ASRRRRAPTQCSPAPPPPRTSTRRLLEMVRLQERLGDPRERLLEAEDVLRSRERDELDLLEPVDVLPLLRGCVRGRRRLRERLLREVGDDDASVLGIEVDLAALERDLVRLRLECLLAAVPAPAAIRPMTIATASAIAARRLCFRTTGPPSTLELPCLR